MVILKIEMFHTLVNKIYLHRTLSVCRRAGLVQAVESYRLWPECPGFESRSPRIVQARVRLATDTLPQTPHRAGALCTGYADLHSEIETCFWESVSRTIFACLASFAVYSYCLIQKNKAHMFLYWNSVFFRSHRYLEGRLILHQINQGIFFELKSF